MIVALQKKAHGGNSKNAEISEKSRGEHREPLASLPKWEESSANAAALLDVPCVLGF
jgi:hypothetical protein